MDLSTLPPDILAKVLEGPAMALPPGVESNFDHPSNRNDYAYAALCVTLILSTLAFVTRAWSKIFIIKRVNFVDFLILGAYACATAHAWVVTMIMKHPGYFVHQWDVRVKDVAIITYAIHMGVNFYLGSVIAIKAAIILEWFRLFNPTGQRNTFFWLGYTILWLNTVFYASAIFVENLTCIPQRKIWDKTIPGHCIDGKEYYIATAAFNVVSDIFILVLPQKKVWQLNIKSRSQKLGLSLIFAVGIITCAIAIIRTYATTHYTFTEDQIYALSPMSISTHCEMTGLLLVICIPSVPKVFASCSTGLKSSFATLRHWMRSSSNRTYLVSSGSDGRQDDVEGLKTSHGVVREIGTPATNESSEIAMNRLWSSYATAAPNADPGLGHHPDHGAAGGYYKTVEVEASSARRSQSSYSAGEERLNAYHPWDAATRR